VPQTIDLIEQRDREYEQMLEDNAFFTMRTQGVGVISRELALDVGVAGRCCAARVSIRSAPRAPVFVVRGLRLRVPSNRGRLLRALQRADGRVPRVDQDRPADSRRLPEGPISSRPGVKSVRRCACRRARPTRASRARAAKSAAICRRWRRQALPDEVARRVVLESRRAAAHHSRPHVADVVAIMGSVDPVFGEVDR
jgi:NADH-quinone oxidoreductase subunit D